MSRAHAFLNVEPMNGYGLQISMSWAGRHGVNDRGVIGPWPLGSRPGVAKPAESLSSLHCLGLAHSPSSPLQVSQSVAGVAYTS